MNQASFPMIILIQFEKNIYLNSQPNSTNWPSIQL